MKHINVIASVTFSGIREGWREDLSIDVEPYQSLQNISREILALFLCCDLDSLAKRSFQFLSSSVNRLGTLGELSKSFVQS